MAKKKQTAAVSKVAPKKKTAAKKPSAKKAKTPAVKKAKAAPAKTSHARTGVMPATSPSYAQKLGKAERALKKLQLENESLKARSKRQAEELATMRAELGTAIKEADMAMKKSIEALRKVKAATTKKRKI